MVSREEFLAVIEASLDRRLAPEQIRERLAEIAAHVDDAVAAYSEMGLDEEEAVRSMGCPQKLARGVAREALALWDHRRLYLAAIAMAGFGANLSGISLLGQPWITQGVAVISVAATVGAALCALRAQRGRLPALFAMGLALVGPVAVSRAILWINVPYPGGRGHFPRYLADERWARALRKVSGEEQAWELRELARSRSESLAVQTGRQAGVAIGTSATLVLVLGAVDSSAALLGLAVLALKRRSRVRGDTQAR